MFFFETQKRELLSGTPHTRTLGYEGRTNTFVVLSFAFSELTAFELLWSGVKSQRVPVKIAGNEHLTIAKHVLDLDFFLHANQNQQKLFGGALERLPVHRSVEKFSFVLIGLN
jgi:hypothetical protein